MSDDEENKSPTFTFNFTKGGGLARYHSRARSDKSESFYVIIELNAQRSPQMQPRGSIFGVRAISPTGSPLTSSAASPTEKNVTRQDYPGKNSIEILNFDDYLERLKGHKQPKIFEQLVKRDTIQSNLTKVEITSIVIKFQHHAKIHAEYSNKMFLSLGEFKDIMGVPDSFIEILFQKFDVDNSRLLNVHEFAEGMGIFKNLGEPKTRIKTAFTLFDSNGDGRLDIEEFEYMLAVMKDFAKQAKLQTALENVSDYLDERDVDDNISYSSFLNWVKEEDDPGSICDIEITHLIDHIKSDGTFNSIKSTKKKLAHALVEIIEARNPQELVEGSVGSEDEGQSRKILEKMFAEIGLKPDEELSLKEFQQWSENRVRYMMMFDFLYSVKERFDLLVSETITYKGAKRHSSAADVERNIDNVTVNKPGMFVASSIRKFRAYSSEESAAENSPSNMSMGISKIEEEEEKADIPAAAKIPHDSRGHNRSSSGSSTHTNASSISMATDAQVSCWTKLMNWIVKLFCPHRHQVQLSVRKLMRNKRTEELNRTSPAQHPKSVIIKVQHRPSVEISLALPSQPAATRAKMEVA